MMMKIFEYFNKLRNRNCVSIILFFDYYFVDWMKFNYAQVLSTQNTLGIGRDFHANQVRRRCRHSTKAMPRTPVRKYSLILNVIDHKLKCICLTSATLLKSDTSGHCDLQKAVVPNGRCRKNKGKPRTSGASRAILVCQSEIYIFSREACIAYAAHASHKKLKYFSSCAETSHTAAAARTTFEYRR